MQSLEKVFLQCHSFVHVRSFTFTQVLYLLNEKGCQDIHRKYSATASPKGSSSNDLQGDLAMFLSLHKSLYQKSSKWKATQL